MNIVKILAASLAGTSMMTLFSYQVSKLEKQQFREPVLLSKLLSELVTGSTRSHNAEGWLLHYAVGTGFSTVYHALWRNTKMKPSLINGVLLGAVSGVVGIAGWHTVMSLHPNPPRVNLKKYYGHLFAAHLVFGAFAAVGYNSAQSRKNLFKSPKTSPATIEVDQELK